VTRVSACDPGAQEVEPNSSNAHTSSAALDTLGRPILSEYMTPEELARELRVCKRTLDRWHAGRTGPPRITVGRKPLYRRAAVAQWLLKRERGVDEDGGERRAGRRGV
jgi:hypothetical protein